MIHEYLMQTAQYIASPSFIEDMVIFGIMFVFMTIMFAAKQEPEMLTWEIAVIRNGAVFKLTESFAGYFECYSWALQHCSLHGGIVQSIKEIEK